MNKKALKLENTGKRFYSRLETSRGSSIASDLARSFHSSLCGRLESRLSYSLATSLYYSLGASIKEKMMKP
jgi:hypothetical protein